MATKAPLIYAEEKKSGGIPPERFGPHVGLAFWAAAGVLLLGTFLDLGVLWIVQRQNVPQWEFVALVNTLEAYPRLALGVALVYGALYFRQSGSLVGYRLLALLVLLLGVGAAGLGGMVLTDFFVLSKAINPEGLAALRSTAIKGLALSGIFFLMLVATGLLGLRRPKG